MRSAIDELATRLCCLSDEASNGERIKELIWEAFDSAQRGHLDESGVLIVAAQHELEMAEREVGTVGVRLEARVMPKFVDSGPFMTLKRTRWDT